MNISNILAGQYTPQQINKIIAKAKQLPYDEQVELANLLGQYENALKVKKCQNSFIDFVKEMWPAFIPGRHHDIMADAFERVANGTCKRLIINMAPRHALSLDTKIITAEGWKTIAEIEVGDMVFHPDGNPVEVIGVSNIFTDREIYRVSTDDGRYVDVDGEHLWTVRLSRKHGVFHTYSTEDLHRRQSGAILKTKRGGGVYIKETDSDGKSIRNPMLPAVSPLNIRDVDLPIDPYMLGVWLGDGSKNNGVITQHDEDQRILRPIIESKGYKTTDQSTRFTFGVLGLKEQLRSIGVLFDKHIPEQYIMSSPTQRMELVRGLMDTDGNVSKVGQCFFANKNKRIIDSFRIILHSLGIKNSLLEQRVFLYGKYHGLHYKVSFYAKDISKLPRKNDRAVGHTKAVGRYISIKKLNFKSETRCIKVNREDGLFLAGEGMIPTHNTKSEFSSYLLPAWFLGKYPDKKIIQTAHTAELAVGFGRKVRNLVGNPHYQKIFPNVSLSSDSKAAGRWNTNKGGDYFAIGIGGAVTGKGADCVYFSCKCLTLNGIIPISQVKVGDEVYGYDHKSKKTKWTRVLAVSTQYKPELVSVGGFICTPDHRIYDGSKYTRADQAHRFAVLPMWKDLSKADEGVREGSSPLRDLKGEEVFLFHGVQEEHGVHQFLSSVRGVEGESSSKLQELLPERQACEDELHVLREGFFEGFCGGQEEPRETRDGQQFLQKDLLHPVDEIKAKGICSDDRKLQYLRLSVPGGQTVLRDGLLCKAEGKEQGLHRGVELQEASGQIEGQGTLRLLWEGQAEDCGASHQPRFIRPQDGESSDALRTMSWQLSSNSVGTCAEDLKILLRGSGHWVVDIQTESENFFCEGVLAHNCLIIDDPHSEQEAAIAAANPSIYDGVYEWYTSGPRQRLQPGGAIVIVMTRWSKRDLCGQILKASSQKDGLDEWEVIEFPAIMPSGNPLWPEFWPLEELEKIKAELPVAKWNAQYQQNPTSEASALIKREWWKIWEKDEPPVCEYIIQSWDTALTKSTRADYSACTTWGIFYEKDNDGKKVAKIILLNAYQGKLEFPELKQKALEEYRYWNPDCCIIEAKAAGGPLVFELRKMGIPIQDYTPSRGNDKIVRVNAVSDIFASGFVYAPPLRWAEELIEQFASFPNSDHDDLVDSSAQALLRFRQGGFISTQNDEDEEYVPNKKADYY